MKTYDELVKGDFIKLRLESNDKLNGLEITGIYLGRKDNKIYVSGTSNLIDSVKTYECNTDEYKLELTCSMGFQ